MTLALSGSTGFVGKYLSKFFQEKGYTVLALTRSVIANERLLQEYISQADAVINLAGATIIKRWSQSYKKVLFESRINTTKAIVNAINNVDNPPILLSTSAIGIYKKDALYDEDATEFSKGFLSQLCQAWEAEAFKADTRVAILRLSVVLGRGGALQKMLTPFKLGLGGRIASGEQAFSFIHIHDLARACEHIIKDAKLIGLFNITTPHATNNLVLTQKLAKKLHRSAFLPLPAWLLKAMFGEGSATLIQGEWVYPKHLLESGFTFNYPSLDESLDNLL